MSLFLNFGSLVLGLLAWILPVVTLMRYKKLVHSTWVALSMVSLSASALSLLFQIVEITHRVKVADWSALLDTMPAVASVSAVLLFGTIILNTMTLLVYRDRTAT